MSGYSLLWMGRFLGGVEAHLYQITGCPASGEEWLTCEAGFLTRCHIYCKAYKGDDVESLPLQFVTSSG